MSKSEQKTSPLYRAQKNPAKELLEHAHMTSNQSGAEKDNRLLFREQWNLLFSKFKLTEVIFSQSGGELRIQMAVATRTPWAAVKPGN